MEDNEYKEFKEARELQEIKKKKEDLSWNFNFKIHNVEDHARLILEANPLYYDDLKTWWRWDKKELFWREITEPKIIEFVKKAFEAQGMSVSTNRTTMLNALKDESQSRVPKAPPDTWIQIGSKIYDIRNEDVIEPHSEYFVKTKIPYEIGKTEETPFIDNLFEEWQGENKDILYDIVAYTISPKQFLDVFFFFQGKGSDGKSAFIKLLIDLVGDDKEIGVVNSKSGNLELLSDPTQRFETITLKDKLLCILGDGNFGVIKNTKMLKEASGSTDKIRAELKGSKSNNLDFYNTATIIGSFNTLPETTDKTKGFYRRVHLTFWKKEFTGDRNVNIELMEKHSHELNNLLKRSISRLREIYKTRKIKGKDEDWTKTKKIYEENANPLKMFIRDEMIEEFNGCFSKSKFYSEYSIWAEKNGFNNFNFQEVDQRLTSMNIDYMKTHSYRTAQGWTYRNEEDIPELFKTSQIEHSQIRLLRGFSFRKQLKKYNSKVVTVPLVPNVTGFETGNSYVRKIELETPSQTSQTSQEDFIKIDTNILNYLLVGKKYSFTTLLELSNKDEEELEIYIEKLITAGDLMVVDGKYMLVQ